mgnify:CR=1 FL=1
MTSLLGAFLAQIVIISYREYAGSGVAGGGINKPAQAPISAPLPSAYAAPIIVYGALALVPGQGQRVAGAIGWGFVVATLLNLWNPAGKVNPAASQLSPNATLTNFGINPAAPQPAAGTDYTRNQAPGFMGPLPSS